MHKGKKRGETRCQERGGFIHATLRGVELFQVDSSHGYLPARPCAATAALGGCFAASAASFCASGDGLPFPSAVTAGCASKPSCLRSSCSILPRMSAFSFRNTRAFSRPWPRRSFLYEIQVPDFSSKPLLTPRSIKSPSRETPSP